MLGTLLLAMAITSTDQTVQVSKGTKLDVNNFAGDVIVKVWDRDAVRVEVTHSDRESVDIKQADQVVTIRSRSARGGPPRSLDYAITVPIVDGDQRQRQLCRRDDGGRRRRRQRRDDPRRHQRARRLGVRVAEVGAGRGDARKGEGPHRGPRGQRGHPPRRHQRRPVRRVDQRQHHPRPHRLGQRRPLHRQRQHLLRRADQGQGRSTG